MNITVYLGAREGNTPAFREAAAEVGEWIARDGHRLIYGGSGVGLMGVLADAVVNNGGEAIGVEPQFFIDDGLLHEGITKTIPTQNMADRRVLMMEMGMPISPFPAESGPWTRFPRPLSWESWENTKSPVSSTIRTDITIFCGISLTRWWTAIS